jgi:hypothetical protein
MLSVTVSVAVVVVLLLVSVVVPSPTIGVSMLQAIIIQQLITTSVMMIKILFFITF